MIHGLGFSAKGLGLRVMRVSGLVFLHHMGPVLVHSKPKVEYSGSKAWFKAQGQREAL